MAPQGAFFMGGGEGVEFQNPSFDPGPIDELRSNSDSGEGDEERSDEAPQGWFAERAINPVVLPAALLQGVRPAGATER
jgi:hypothetical protein